MEVAGANVVGHRNLSDRISDLPCRSSHVAQLFSLGSKTPRKIYEDTKQDNNRPDGSLG